jgi:hypothetical protein
LKLEIIEIHSKNSFEWMLFIRFEGNSREIR